MLKLLLFILFLTLAVTGYSQKIRVIENSRLAKIIAKIKHEPSYAITFGKTIFISCKREEFYAQKWWVKHELAHVQQYQQHGVKRFIALYVYYSIFHRKSGNPFEIEAETAERRHESSTAFNVPE